MDAALEGGYRGLPGGSSLAKLLADQRGVRNDKALPPLSPPQILAWADAHYQRTGAWPTTRSGPISETSGETWVAMEVALQQGHRGLPGGSSLAKLLADQRGVRNDKALPPLSPRQILAWADSHHTRTGTWPKQSTGPIPEAPGETWQAVDGALRMGQRGLPGGSSLARFLARRRGVRNRKALPRLTLQQIVAWARRHRRETGKWPSRCSGPAHGSDGETWGAIAMALHQGGRGLPGGSSLAQLLAKLKEGR